MTVNIQENYIIKTIKDFLHDYHENAFVVGGFLRDCLLGHVSNDVDVVVKNGSARSFSIAFSDYLQGYWVELDSENNIYRVVFPDKSNYVDVADCVGASIEEDLLRRDFTINAIAYDILNEKYIDVTKGAEDLKNGIIREVGKDNIVDDAIRILRAFRFKSQLGFEFSEELKNVLKEHAMLLQKTAKERINIELIKIFAGKNTVNVLFEMDSLGLLELLVPEVSQIKKIPPNSHHHLNLFEHSIETVKHVQKFYEEACSEVQEHLDEIVFGGCKRLSYLKFAAFLHDVGKPATWQIEPDTGRHRFIMHDSEGAKIIVPTLKNLKFSKKQITYIQKIIKNHIYPAGVVTSADASEKAYLRFYRKMDAETIDLIAVAYADRLSALGPDISQDMIEQNINGLKLLLDGYLQQKNNMEPLPKLIDGREIMQITGLSPSPELGLIINKLKEAQLSSDVNTKEEAIAFIKNISPKD